MDPMIDIARRAISQMPPACRIRPADGEVISRLKDVLLPLEPAVVQGFYDTLYAHEVTARVFVPGERPDREMTLSNWWRRTVIGPIDDDYLAWMAQVGLVHVIREVSNPMMLAMAGFIRDLIKDQSAGLGLPAEERAALIDAFSRLTTTIGAIITYGYDQAASSALFDVAGMPEPLLHRLRNTEISKTLQAIRSGQAAAASRTGGFP